jgi:hypothetical protein
VVEAAPPLPKELAALVVLVAVVALALALAVLAHQAKATTVVQLLTVVTQLPGHLVAVVALAVLAAQA